MTLNKKLSRRSVVSGIGLSVVCTCLPSYASNQDTSLTKLLALERQLGGRIGVSAIDTRNGARLTYRADERFAMCSTFKLLLAADVLAGVDRGNIKLTQQVPYGSADLLDYAPVTRVHVAEGTLSVETLTASIVEVSDNTAANLLLPLVGGPSGLTDHLRTLGDSVTRLDRNESELNSNLLGDERDTATPNAMIATMQRILIGNALSLRSRNRLIDWMKQCRTGLERLRAGLPSNWIAGDKTGTGANGAVNDLAIVWPPKRAPILIAVYMSESTRRAAELNAAHAKIGRMIVETFS